MNRKITGSLMLLTTACIWGLAFVFQSTALEYIGNLTISCLRMFLGGLVLLPFAIFAGRKLPKVEIKDTIRSGIICGIVLCIASTTQQYGIASTTVGKASFISALYIVIVPLVGLLLGKSVAKRTWLAVFVAVIGFWLLCINEDFYISRGDLLVFLSAFGYAGHILVIDHFSEGRDGVIISCVQCLMSSALTLLPMLLIERPTFGAIWAGRMSLFITGVLSCGIAYTLQTLGQKRTPAAAASLIMCLESVFGALFGYIILHQALSPREIAGCAFVFSAALIVNLKNFKKD